MEHALFTPRLKMTLMTTAERGSKELEWMHELRRNKETTFWSILGKSESIEDTEKALASTMCTKDGNTKSDCVSYFVHRILEVSQTPNESSPKLGREAELIGHVVIYPIHDGSLPLPEDLTQPPDSMRVDLEVGYMFLPDFWGKGYATEALQTVLWECRRKRSFWAPFSKAYVRALVNEENVASQRVMEKTGMRKHGVYHWTGNPVFLAGKWTTESSVGIYGTFLFGEME